MNVEETLDFLSLFISLLLLTVADVAASTYKM